MLKESPDHLDADLILKIYDLRREPVMRESRARIATEFWPKSAVETLAVFKADHPLNAAYRQVSSYWEMVYGMARHGIIHADFLAENNGEGLLLFARVEPYLDQIRAATSPRAFQSAEWIAHNSASAQRILETFRARVAKTLAGK